MPKALKTFEVEKIKHHFNEQLARTDEYATSTEGFKAGLCAALEYILHQTNNYKGYMDNYWREKGCEEWNTIGNKTEVWEEKKVFIYGTPDSKYRGNQHSRYYY